MSVDARIAGNIYSLPGQIVTFTAAENISKGEPVYISGDMTVSKSTAKHHHTIGVAVTNALQGKSVSVLMGCPIVYMTAQDNLSAGIHVVPYEGKITVADVAEQPVNEGGSATYTFSASFIVGVTLEAINAGAVGRVAVMQQIVCLTP